MYRGTFHITQLNRSSLICLPSLLCSSARTHLGHCPGLLSAHVPRSLPRLLLADGHHRLAILEYMARRAAKFAQLPRAVDGGIICRLCLLIQPCPLFLV